jgi:hypothetical protein
VPLLLVGALAGCGEDVTLSAAQDPPATVSASPSKGTAPAASPVAGTGGGGASEPDRATSSPTSAPAATPTGRPVTQATTQPPAPGDGPDLDGDGRADSVTLLEVPGMGWSFDVRLADGRETSAPLPLAEAVVDDVAVLGPVDLDRDGADEVLVRTLRAVGGENAVVFRLDGDGVWLLRDREGAPWELSTSGGMTGPRSWTCRDGEVLTRESERTPEGTYRAMTWRWTLDGHVAGPLGGARDDALAAEEVSLDPSACRT